jgi:hypothetical protein
VAPFANTTVDTRRIAPAPPQTPSFFAVVPLSSNKSNTSNHGDCSSVGNNSLRSSNAGSSCRQPFGGGSVGHSDKSNHSTMSKANENVQHLWHRCLPVTTWTRTIDRITVYKVSFVILVEILFLWSFIEQGLHTCSMNSSTNQQATTQHHNSKIRHPFGSTTVSSCELQDHFVTFYALFLTLLPYLLFVALPDLPIQCIWICLLATVLIECVMTAYLQTYYALISVIVYFIFIAVIVIDTQIHKVLLFLTTRKLGAILEENERNVVQNNAQEMRHMIANVAHDLKTVSL